MQSAATVPSTETASSESMVRRALSGDRQAEREVCGRLLPAIRAFARRRLRDASAEDFAQDVLLLLVEALRDGRIQQPEHVSSFALGICRNLAREGARLTERRQLLMETYGFTEAELAVLGAPLEVRRDHLEDCYSQLTERARSILRATFCNDDDDREIAEAVGVTAANVRVIRHRTLAALRSCLERPISWVQQ